MRYATPSPAAACERNRPFFLKTKEDPMRTPLTMARTMPTILRLALDEVAVEVEVAVAVAVLLKVELSDSFVEDIGTS